MDTDNLMKKTPSKRMVERLYNLINDIEVNGVCETTPEELVEVGLIMLAEQYALDEYRLVEMVDEYINDAVEE